MNEELKKLIAKFEEIGRQSERIGTENRKALDAIRTDIEKLKGGNADAASLSDLEDRINAMEAKAKQPGKVGRQPDATGAKFFDPKTGEMIQTLSHKDRLADLEPNRSGVTLGQWLYSKIVGDRGESLPKDVREGLKALATSPDGSGGYTVPAPLSGTFIDLLRAASVLSRAGVTTVPMTSKTLTLAKLLTDPVVAWRAENASVNETEPTFGAVTLSSKTVAGIVKLSFELSQDSFNIQEVLVRSLTQATALAIDHAGLLGTGVGEEPAGVTTYAGRQTITGVGTLANYDPFITAVGKLLGVNVPLERATGAAVMGVDVWTALAKLKTGLSGDQTPLVRPSAIQTMEFLPTTAVPTSAGSPQDGSLFVADWADLLLGMRNNIMVRVLNEAFFGSNMQLAVIVYARCDFQPVRESSFVTLEDVAAN